MPAKLTARQLETLKAPADGRIELTDSLERGLKFRLTAGGQATWSLLLRVGGRQRRFPIGGYPAVSLSEARERARRLRVEAQDGRDPIAEKRLRAGAAAPLPVATLSPVIDDYAERHLRKLADGRRREGALRAALVDLLDRSTNELSRAARQALIDDKARTAPIAANRLCAYLAHFAGWAYRRDHFSENIGVGLEKPMPEKSRDRILSLEELAAIWRGCEGLSPIWRGFVRLLMLTAQRRGDLAGMRWTEIDGNRWSIPAARTKTRRPHIVHLSAASLAQLLTLKDHSGGNSGGYVFTTTGVQPVSGFTKMKLKLDALSEVQGWTLHDFRTAFATHSAERGVAGSVVDRVLNHAASASIISTLARVYRRSELLGQRAQALEDWSGLIEGVTQRCGEVVQ